MKIVLAICGNILTSYLLIAGLRNPEMIGFVKNHNNTFIQPDTIILQVCGWLFMMCLYLIITTYLISKVSRPDKKINQ